MRCKWTAILVSMVLATGLGLLAMPQPTIAATCTWVGGTSSDWNDPNNWSNCGSGVPGSTDDVILPSSGVTYEPTFNTAVAIHSLTIESGRTLTADANLSVGGNWTNNGTFTASAGTVHFNNATTQSISGSGSTTFYNLTVGGTNQILNLNSDINITNAFIRNSGGTFNHGSTCTNTNGPAITFTGSGASITVNATTTFCDLKVTSTGTLVYNGTNKIQIDRVLHVDGVLNYTGSGILEFQITTNTGRITGSGSAILSNLQTSGASKAINPLSLTSLTITGNVNNPGTVEATGGTVTFDKPGDTITCCGSGTFTYNNVTIASNTTLNHTAGTINVKGNWTNNGTFTASTGTVTFNKSGIQTLAGSTTFNNVTVNSGSTLQLAANGNFGYKGTFTLNGTFDAITNSNTTVTIAGTTAQQLPTGATTLRNLTINSGASLSAPSTLSIRGNFSNSGTFTHNSGTVAFEGGTTQSLTLNSATTFNNLTVGTGTILEEASPTDNATVNGTLTNNGTIRKSQSISGTGLKTFGLTGIKIDVTSHSGLSNLQVDRIDSDHTHKTTLIGLGKYWTITATGSGDTVSITLPHGFSGNNVRACRYTGSGPTGWDCGTDAENSNTSTEVTRTGVTEFSDWAAGDNVGPNTIALRSLNAIAAAPDTLPILLPVLASVMLGVGLLACRRRAV